MTRAQLAIYALIVLAILFVVYGLWRLDHPRRSALDFFGEDLDAGRTSPPPSEKPGRVTQAAPAFPPRRGGGRAC